VFGRICLDCRVTLADGEACTWLSHRAAELAGECRPLIATVWGPEGQRDRPLGAATEPMVPVTATGFRGRIAEGPTVRVPMRDQQAVGWALEVWHDEAAGSPIMLRDGASAGFTVVGDDSRLLLVPPAGIRMALDHGADIERNRRRIGGYLRQLAPHAGEPWPFPFDEVRMVVLSPDDMVTVRAVVSVSPDPRARAAYRDPPRSILVATSAAWVERHG
jgi:hypothetical protein